MFSTQKILKSANLHSISSQLRNLKFTVNFFKIISERNSYTFEIKKKKR